jgi:hypothetical protein
MGIDQRGAPGGVNVNIYSLTTIVNGNTYDTQNPETGDTLSVPANTSYTLRMDVENNGGTGVLSPDNCEGGQGTLLQAEIRVPLPDTLMGYTVGPKCHSDRGFFADEPPRWLYKQTGLQSRNPGQNGRVTFWVEGSETGDRMTPIYFLDLNVVAEDEQPGNGTGDGETDDGSGGGDQPTAFGSDFSVTNREWFEEDGEVVVAVTIEGGDGGGAQGVPVTYYIDGNEFASGVMAGQGVAPAETDTDEEEIELANIEPGDHLLEVEVGDAGVLEVDTITVEERPSGDPAAQLSIENCDAAEFGSGATVSVDIANTSEFSITTDVEMRVAGQTAATIEAVAVGGGQSLPISQQVPLPDSPGDYQITVSTTNASYDSV